MKSKIKLFLITGIAFVAFSSCTTLHKTMREPNTRVELDRNDFILSEQVTAEAHSTKVFGIDWGRIFHEETGEVKGRFSDQINLASIPVVGNYVSNKTANYALYELMRNNPGYDVVFYPQYETKMRKPILGIGVLYNKTTVKSTARLAKFK